jgi:hypothetical protein
MLDERDWFRVEGASPEELANLKAFAPPDLPSRYVDLLTFSNGGEGPLPMNPYNLCLDEAGTVADGIATDNHGRADLNGFIVFGGNGGGEYIAFDTRSGAPWSVVCIDMVAGAISAEVIAPNFDAFYDRIGVEAATS